MDTMERVLNYLKDAGAFYVTTVEGEKPKVRPHSFVMEYDGKLCFTTNNQKPTYKQICENSNIEICTMGKDGGWLRLHGKATFCTDKASKAAALEAMPALKQMYSVDDDLLEVFCLNDAQTDFCSMFATETVTL